MNSKRTSYFKSFLQVYYHRLKSADSAKLWPNSCKCSWRGPSFHWSLFKTTLNCLAQTPMERWSNTFPVSLVFVWRPWQPSSSTVGAWKLGLTENWYYLREHCIWCIWLNHLISGESKPAWMQTFLACPQLPDFSQKSEILRCSLSPEMLPALVNLESDLHYLIIVISGILVTPRSWTSFGHGLWGCLNYIHIVSQREIIAS